MTQTLVIPNWHPKRLNELLHCHFAVRSRRKKADREIVAGYALACGLVKATGKRRVRLHLTLAPRQRAGDGDAYFKSLLDSLVHAGLLVDDSRQWCEIEMPTFDRGTQKASRIELEDISD